MKIIIKMQMTLVAIVAVVNFNACGKKEANDFVISQEVADEVATEITSKEEICIYIVGEVVNPGVYSFDKNARVNDVVEAAGGFTENAAKEYVNLAKKVIDGEQIIIYSMEDVENGVISQDTDSKLVNINTADKDLLMTLPGIGESKAGDIISYREINGSYACIEDIMKVSGIKEAAFNKIKEYITVN